MSTGKRWAYSAAVVGGAVSVLANVAHSFVPAQPTGVTDEAWRTLANAEPQPFAIGLAAFWPAALLLAIEVIARVDWPDHWRWALVRWGGVTPVAAVAAVVSYRHLSGLLHWYGEDPVTVGIGPLAVDGLMVVSTGALLALGTSRVQEVHELVPAQEPAETSRVQVQVQTVETLVPRHGHELELDPDATVALSLDVPATPTLDPIPVVQSPASLTLVDSEVDPIAWIKERIAAGGGFTEIVAEGSERFGVSKSTMKRRYNTAREAVQATA